ncbi:MAG: peptidoglycan DD-metalloendopeptidase family protein [Anaerolineae bacterium]|nr:peptidoglycan DD-metalloendopeptidase family protein [Anaerolineae bacterium]
MSSPYPPAVPKPASPGSSQTVIANTRAAYVNVRNGPSTDYRDIGDIYDNTVIAYYPNTRTDSGWVWAEQGQLAGWIATSVVTFETIQDPTPTPRPQPTPYDGKVAVWHWKGDVLAENTIDEFATTIKRYAPQVTEIFVKTSDYTPRSGARWQGYWDNDRVLAIDGPSSIDNWVQVLGRYGLNFHAWCVVRGLDVTAETNLIVQACLRPGVRSMLLDVEPYDGFWSGGKAGIRPYMLRIRRQIPGAFHIGMSVDPRPQHYATIFPEEWFPFVNSIHPQVYWVTFRKTPSAALDEAFQVWGNYGRPIIPVLQGDAQVQEMTSAHTIAVQRHQAPGVSWWRMGVIGPAQWPAVNLPVTPGTPDPDPTPPPTEQYGEEIVIRPTDSGFAKGSYTGKNEFLSFAGTWGWTVFYKATSTQRSQVWAQWSPSLSRSAKYEVAAFVPSRHATTLRARYKIHGVKNSTSEVVVEVDQSRYFNQWVPLGIYEFDRAAVNAGAVFLNDLTYESGLEIGFDAMRWREIVEGGSGDPQQNLADGYDSPVGTLTERRSTSVWPGSWIDASPFAQIYFPGTPNQAYHTGADLNLPADADRHIPVYAAASGVVVFASRLATWGNVIIIRHDPLATNRKVLYSRSAHVEEMIVQVGQRVRRGEQIARVGNAFGQWAYHLHFDLSPTTILASEPQHWPGMDLAGVLKNYVDPRLFIGQNRPK